MNAAVAEAIRPLRAPADVTAEAMREAVGRFPTGVTVVTANIGGRPHGMTVSAFVPVSLDPPLVLVSLAKASRIACSLDCVDALGISVLSKRQAAISNHFADPQRPEGHAGFRQVDLGQSADAVPLIDGAAAHLLTRRRNEQAAGDHVLLVLEVESIQMGPARPPLVHHEGDYKTVGTDRV